MTQFPTCAGREASSASSTDSRTSSKMSGVLNVSWSMDASLSVLSAVTVIVTRIAISLSLLRAGALKAPGLEPPGIDQFGCIVTVPHPGDLHRPVRGVSLVQCRDELVPGRVGRNGDDLHFLSRTPGERV